MLLIGAGLLLNSFVRLINVDAGFRADHVLTMRVTLPGSSYDNMERINSFYERLVDSATGAPPRASHPGRKRWNIELVGVKEQESALHRLGVFDGSRHLR